MITRISTKGQIVLPADLRSQDGIEPGNEFEIERLDRGQYLLRHKVRIQNQGMVDWLLSCPEKDWFQPADRSETTDDIPVPSFK